MLSVALRTRVACLLLLLPYLVTKLLCPADPHTVRPGLITVSERNEVHHVVIYLFALELEWHMP